uniref:Uncharacterized protein n=1 Tax=viral metagenome TaxID=1070528 RepID=A0A6C0KDC8_9ZZZZ
MKQKLKKQKNLKQKNPAQAGIKTNYQPGIQMVLVCTGASSH